MAAGEVLLADFGLPVATEVCNAAGKLRLDLSERANVFKHLVASPAQRIIDGRTGVSGRGVCDCGSLGNITLPFSVGLRLCL